MSSYFIVPLSPEYLSLSANLKETLSDRGARSQAAQSVKMMELFVDSVIEAIINDLIASVEMNEMAKKACIQIGSLGKKTLGLMYSRSMSKLSNQKLKPLIDHFQSMEMEIDGVNVLGIPIEEKHYNQAQECFADFEDGEIKAVQNLSIEFSAVFVPIVLSLMIKDGMGLLKPGMIASKIIDVAHTTLVKSSLIVMPKVYGSFNVDNMRSYQTYMSQMFFSEAC